MEGFMNMQTDDDVLKGALTGCKTRESVERVFDAFGQHKTPGQKAKILDDIMHVGGRYFCGKEPDENFLYQRAMKTFFDNDFRRVSHMELVDEN